MKNNHSYRHFKIVGILFSLMINAGLVKSQDTLKTDKKLYYRLTMGVGIGSGYPLQEDDYGIGGNIEFALQKQKAVYSLGISGVQEFQILGVSHPAKSIGSIDLTYGKALKRKSLYASLSAGAGWVTSVQRGKFLSSDGGWFGTDYYEKITHQTIGFPISVKIFWVPLSFTGVGLELYANINSLHTFYGINICRQFGKLRPAIKKDKNLAAKILLLLLL